jgi:signal transduction histidine kinase
MNAVADNIYLLVLAGMGGAIFLVVAFVFLYMRNQNKLLVQRELQQQAEIEHQKSLLAAVIQSQEGERKRIGQDLHDDVGAALSNLRLTMDMVDAGIITTDSFKKFASSYKQSIDHIITDVRHISHNLSPPRLSLFGLNAALEDLTDVIPRSGIKLALDNNAADILAVLDITIATTLYRVFEELIHNTIKHAAANHIFITLSVENKLLTIDYKDDGIGLPMDDGKKIIKGMGMQNIESRFEYDQCAVPDR